MHGENLIDKLSLHGPPQRGAGGSKKKTAFYDCLLQS